MTVQLGSYQFDPDQLEEPESIGDLGLYLAVAEHDFPGGVRTQQQFGAFLPAIRWRAHFSGSDALDDIAAVRQILADGVEITLAFLDRQFLGLFSRFTLQVQHQFSATYELEFMPRQETTGLGVRLALDLEAAANAVISIIDLHLASITGIITGLANGTVSVSSLLPAALPELLGPAGQFVAGTMAIVQANTGTISSLTASNSATITTQGNALIATTQPYTQSTDPASSSAACDLTAHTQAIVTAASGAASPPGKWVLRVTNPNLSSLAAQYYGDPTQWQTIAAANGLTDPQPPGNFLLTIPAQAA